MIDFRDIDIVLEAIRTSYAWGEPVKLEFTERRQAILEELCSNEAQEWGDHSFYGSAHRKVELDNDLGLDTWCVRLVK